jgi:hypothetical protein
MRRYTGSGTKNVSVNLLAKYTLANLAFIKVKFPLCFVIKEQAVKTHGGMKI